MEDSNKNRLWCLYYRPEDRFLRGLTQLEVRAIATSLPHMEKIHWLAWKEQWNVWRSLADVEELMVPLSREIKGPMPKVSQRQNLDDLEESDMNTVPTELMPNGLLGEPQSETSLKLANQKRGNSQRSGRDDKSDDDNDELHARRQESRERRRRETEKRERRAARSGQGGERRVEKYNPSTVENMGDITFDGLTANTGVDLEVLEASELNGKKLKDFKARSFKRHRASLRVMIFGPHDQVFESVTEDVSVGGLRLRDNLPGLAIGNIQVKLVNEKKRQAIEITCHVIEGQSHGNRARLMILPLKRKSEEVQFDKWLEAA